MRKLFCAFLVIVLLAVPGLVSGTTYIHSNDIEYDSTISANFGMDDYPPEFFEEVENILSFISPSMSDVEKALAVHEYFMINYSYGYGYTPYLYYSFEPSEAYSAYGIMVNKIGVCNAYTEAYQYIMEKLGIPCIKVTSSAMDHAWNMVYINGKWYHVDVTWDDNIGGHANFLRSDEGIKETGHYGWDADVAADCSKYDNAFWITTLSDFYYINGFWYYLDSGNIDLQHQDGFTIINRSNSSKDGYIKRYDFKTDTHKIVFTVKPKTYLYKIDGESYQTEWEGSQTSIAVWGSKIYYNTNNEIYSINPDGKGNTLVCKVNPVDLFFPDINGRAYIEEIKIKNGTIYYEHSDYGELYTAFNLQDAIPEYIITADSGPGGSISPSGDIGVLHNRSRTFKISADDGCELTDVLVDGVSVGPVSSYTFNSVTSDHSIEALFDVAGGEWQITWLERGLRVAGDFSEGLALVENEDGYGYINTLGELVIPPQTDYMPVEDFNGGLAVVSKNDKYGFIDTSGTLVVPCIYDWISYSENNMFIVEMDSKYGAINSSGELIVPCVYDLLVFNAEGMILAEKDGKFGFLNTAGDLVVPCLYDSIWWFNNGVACLMKDGEETYIDLAGNKISPPMNGLDYFFTDEGKLNSVYKDGKWGFTNALGELVVPHIYDDIRDYYDEFIQVSQNGKWGFLNNNGELVAPCIYDSVNNFREGFAVVCKNRKYGFINTQGEEVVPCIYRYAYNFSDGLAHVVNEVNDGSLKDGYVNTYGELVVPLIYDNVRNFKEGFAAIKANNRWGIMKKASQLSVKKYSNADFYYEIKGSEVKITGLVKDPVDLVIPSIIDGYTVTAIGKSAFENKYFSSIKIPDTVKIVEEFAFYGTRITGDSTLYIPASVKEIQSYAFSYMSGVEAFKVDPLNRNFVSQDGVLFSKDKSTLINYPLGKKGDSYSVPRETTHLYCTSFGNCKQLKHLYVPNKNASMAGYTFFGCDLTVYAETGSPLHTSIVSLAKENYERGKVVFVPIDSETGIIIPENNNVQQPVSPPVENMITPLFGRWAETKNSYLIKNNDGTLSVLEFSDRINIHLFDNKYNNIESRSIDFELPIFGAFYSGEKYNYIAFGQENSDEADSKEVIRIVKYNKNFDRIDSVSVYGGESFTINPFAFSCARIGEYGNQLVLHASRLRYTTEDGLNHQSQLTVVVNTDKMSVINDLGRFQPNHVSHSFNQFVLFDGERHVLVDHGDAYPRSVVLHKQNNDNWYTKVNLFNIPGQTGANFTGVSVGGFQISSKNYIVAINSIDHSVQGEYTNFRKTGLNIDERDIILCVVPKNSLSDTSVKQLKITDYIGTDRYASIPKLVKINDNEFMVLWQEIFSDRSKFGDWPFGDVKYVVIDGSGNIKGEIQTLTDCILSDCDPIVLENKVVWYTNLEDRVFYEIPVK